MANNVSYFMETVYDDEGFVSHWNWEINTRSATLRNRYPIKQSKNTSYISLEHHLLKMCRVKINRMNVKHRNVGSAGYEETKTAV